MYYIRVVEREGCFLPCTIIRPGEHKEASVVIPHRGIKEFGIHEGQEIEVWDKYIEKIKVTVCMDGNLCVI